MNPNFVTFDYSCSMAHFFSDPFLSFASNMTVLAISKASTLIVHCYEKFVGCFVGFGTRICWINAVYKSSNLHSTSFLLYYTWLWSVTFWSCKDRFHQAVIIRVWCYSKFLRILILHISLVMSLYTGLVCST